MNLEILTPEEQLYSGEVEGVKMPGSLGSFEVLNNHAPLIAALTDGEIRIKTNGETKFFSIRSGFVEVLSNEVVILVEGGEESGSGSRQ